MHFVYLLQVYKSQLERVSHGWDEKIGEFERVNGGLKSEMASLKRENDDLRTKVSRIGYKS